MKQDINKTYLLKSEFIQTMGGHLKLKVLYLHQYFKKNAGGTRSYEFSKHLITQGNQVTMITGNETHNQITDGIKVKTTNTKYSQKFPIIKRIFAFIHFMVMSTFIGAKEKNVDVIYATSTPLTIGIPALFIARFKKVKYIFEVRDVWPDIPIELGFIKSTILKKILFKFELFLYKQAAHIVVLSDGMKVNIEEKGVPSSKITVITNLSMNYLYDSIELDEKNEENNKLVCIHPGTMGVVNGLDYILDVAKKYPNKDIEYILIGEGNQKQRLKKRITLEKISNVVIKDSLPKDQVIKEIKLADVGIMIVKNNLILQDNSANKFFDYLAAGLPVLINYGGWQKQVLESNKAGKSFDYRDKEGFYNFLLELKNNKELLNEYSFNSKELAQHEYDSQLLAKEFEEVLLNVVETNS